MANRQTKSYVPRAGRSLLIALAAAWIGLCVATSRAGVGGKLKIDVIDRETREPVACRMHLTGPAGRRLKAPRVPFRHDHFVFDGSITLKLPKGKYDFVIERGLEYLVRSGHFIIEEISSDTKTIELSRFAKMAAEGWWSGDVDAARPARDLELLMRADDLHVVELVTWPGRGALLSRYEAREPLVRFDDNRYYHTSAGIDSRPGGTLLFFNLKQPLELGGLKGEFPPQQQAIAAANSQSGAWVAAREAYGWDVPLWIACGRLDSVQVLNGDLRRAGAADKQHGGKPRNELLFPLPAGIGRWSEAIYFHLLNCGLRIPPTAGSASGEVANPLGYNRMYVHVAGDFSYEKWWEGVRGGRVVVTNGPLIRPDVEGELPGHVFRAEAGQEVELEVGLTLSTRDPVSYLEIVKDGRASHQVRLADWAKTGGRLPPLRFQESGWFVIRAITELTETYRYAMTAPYYVEIGGRPRISKESAQFFIDWVKERMRKIELVHPSEHKAVLKFHGQALAFWSDIAARANAE